MKQPLFSIVIPTRNRPQYIKISLEMLKRQSFDDYEVIISDNGTDLLCKEVFDMVVGGDIRYRYIRPSKSLNQYDNYENAISYARGIYVTLLEDKEFLIDGVLEKLSFIIRIEHPIMLSYKWIEYYYTNEKNCFPTGIVYNYKKSSLMPYKKWNPQNVLQLMWNFERGMYTFLDECPGLLQSGGFYHFSLINKIKKYYNKVFVMYGTDIATQFLGCYLCDEKDSIIQVEKVMVLRSVSTTNCRGARVIKEQEMLKYSWEDCNNRDLKNCELSFCDFIYSSHYFLALEMEWIKDTLLGYGITRGGEISKPNVIANIKWELENYKRVGRTLEEKVHDDMAIEEAISKFSDVEKRTYIECYDKLTNPKHEKDGFLNKLGNEFPKAYSIYLKVKKRFFVQKIWRLLNERKKKKFVSPQEAGDIYSVRQSEITKVK